MLRLASVGPIYRDAAVDDQLEVLEIDDVGPDRTCRLCGGYG
jgi:hypothetical protein